MASECSGNDDECGCSGNGRDHRPSSMDKEYLSGCLEGQRINPECEVFRKTDSFERSFERCVKNPGHADFIPVKEFTMDHLPPKLRSQENVMGSIRITIDRTVRVKVSYTSEYRPECFSDSKAPYPFQEFRGSRRIVRYGTGIIDQWWTTDRLKNKYCPCPLCRTSKDPPKTTYCVLTIHTSTHVIFDDSEAEQATFDLFYDGEENAGMYTMYGIYLSDALTSSINKKYQSDHCKVVCATHDAETIKKISNVLLSSSLPNRIPYVMSSVDPPVGLIVSHPHGGSKRITLGKIDFVTVPVKPSYKTGTPIPLPDDSKCRLSQLEGGGDSRCVSVSSEKRIDVPRHSMSPTPYNVNTPQGSVVAPPEGAKDKTTNRFGKIYENNDDKPSCLIDGRKWKRSDIENAESQHAIDIYYRSHRRQDTSNTGCSRVDRSVPARLGTFFDVMIELLQKESHPMKDEYIQKDQLASLRKRILNLADGLGFDSDFLKRALGAIPDITDISLSNDKMRKKMDAFFQQCMAGVFTGTGLDDRTKGHEKDEADQITRIVDQHQTNRNIHDKCCDCKCVASEQHISDSISGGDGDGFIEKLMESMLTPNMMASIDDMFCYNLTPTNKIDKLSRLDEVKIIDLPYEMTFTLPPDAEFAMRYRYDSPGWFQFPPGTKFTTKNGDQLQIPDGSEFQNAFYHPQHFYATYDIATCPGSSGAIVCADFLHSSQMSRFAHSGSKGEGTVNLSGVQQNDLYSEIGSSIPTLISSFTSAMKSQQMPPFGQSPMENQASGFDLD